MTKSHFVSVLFTIFRKTLRQDRRYEISTSSLISPLHFLRNNKNKIFLHLSAPNFEMAIEYVWICKWQKFIHPTFCWKKNVSLGVNILTIDDDNIAIAMRIHNSNWFVVARLTVETVSRNREILWHFSNFSILLYVFSFFFWTFEAGSFAKWQPDLL